MWIFQYRLPIKNVGLIDLSYQWFLIDSNAILEDSSRSSMSTARSETEGIRSETDPSTEREECVNVSIEPQQGEIAPGGEQIVTFKFSPFELVEFTHWFRCQLVQRKSNIFLYLPIHTCTCMYLEFVYLPILITCTVYVSCICIPTHYPFIHVCICIGFPASLQV